MKTAHPSFPDTHSRIDKELYKRLRWSYNDLPNPNINSCFLYCAMYSEDCEINVRDLVQIWIADSVLVTDILEQATIYKKVNVAAPNGHVR